MGKRGGYKRQRPLYQLTFANDEFEGLEVVARSLPLQEFFDLQRLQARASDDPEAAETIVRKLTEVIVSWNLLGDDDEPVPVAYAVCRAAGKPGEPGRPCSHHQNDEAAGPCEYTGLCEYDLPFVLVIFGAWMESIADIPNHSPGTSSSGETSPGLSIPMEVSSAGRAS